MSIDFDAVPGLVKIRVGDVIVLDGQPHVAVMVNESRAQLTNLKNKSDTKSITTQVSPETIIERRGLIFVTDFLGKKTPLEKEVIEGETNTTTEEDDMAKKSKKASKPKARGGLAAEALAAQSNGEAKPKRGKKKEGASAGGSKGGVKRQKVMDQSMCAVLRALGKDGVTKEHAAAIMKAQGVEASEATVNIHVYQGKMGIEGKAVADLTKAQLKELRDSAEAPAAKEAEPAAA